MVRLLLLAAALALSACAPGSRIDVKDPWATLYPWDAKAENVKTLPSGVQYVVIKKGDGKGEHPAPTDQVTVNYEGRLADGGKTFDSSYERNEPATFRLNQVIPGWTEGLQAMQPGDDFLFFIPAEMGYGAAGAGADIPPNANLLFRVELISVTPAPKATEAAWKRATPWPTGDADIIRTPQGLEYFMITTGPADAPRPTPQDYIEMHFEGRLEDGSVAISTFQAQEPVRTLVSDFVPELSKLIEAMREGDRWMVRVPPQLLYGDQGDGRIPPGAFVTFEFSLEKVIDVTPDEPAGADPKADAPK
jgi:FKBP-type peptidyl-prolyl cis-trans isomerase